MTNRLMLYCSLSALGVQFLPGCTHYDASRFAGDATIRDKGAWSAPPRWTIVFPNISSGEAATHQFTMSGLPSHHLMFVLVPSDDLTKTAMPRSNAIVHVSMADDMGNVLFSGGGPLNPFDRGWKHSEPQYEYYLSDTNSRVPYSTDRRYTLHIAVSAPDTTRTNMEVRPTLAGGGNELSRK